MNILKNHKLKLSVMFFFYIEHPSSSIWTKNGISCSEVFVNFTVHKITPFFPRSSFFRKVCVYTGTIEAVLKPLPASTGPTFWKIKGVRSLESMATGVDWTEHQGLHFRIQWNKNKIIFFFFRRWYLHYVFTCSGCFLINK